MAQRLSCGLIWSCYGAKEGTGLLAGKKMSLEREQLLREISYDAEHVIKLVLSRSRRHNLISQGACIHAEALENAGFKGRTRTRIAKNQTKVRAQILVYYIHLSNGRLASLPYERTQKCPEDAFWSSAVCIDIGPI
jgi:hypothetical protein